MKIAIGCDHGGIALKPAIVEELKRRGVMCGTGIGISIAANKFKGIRAGVVHDEFTAQMIAEHNAANVIALGGRIVSPEQAAKMVGIWLDTPFGGGRHAGRVDKISAIEEENFK